MCSIGSQCNAKFALSSLCSSFPTLSQIVAAPAARFSRPVPRTGFERRFPCNHLGPWTPEEVQACLPSGSPGPDGWTAGQISKLSSDSLCALCQLLDEADAGRMPSFWSDARVVGIPKPGSFDRRPLTVMSTFYRCWAKRLVKGTAPAAESWWPPGLFGARKGRSAAMAANLACLLVEEAKLGMSSPRHVLALDQAKCFDRLLLPAIAALVREAGLPDIYLLPLRHYATLRRILVLDGCVTPFVIHGANGCGIPQGCPLSAFFCNLVAAAWERQVRRVGSELSVFTFLDDRIIIASDCQQFEDAMLVSDRFDEALGSSLNMSKCRRAVAGGRSRLLDRVGPQLQRFETAHVLRYMGIDLCVLGAELALKLKSVSNSLVPVAVRS